MKSKKLSIMDFTSLIVNEETGLRTIATHKTSDAMTEYHERMPKYDRVVRSGPTLNVLFWAFDEIALRGGVK